MPILQIPEGANTLELSNSIVWIDNGIMYSRPKTAPYVHQTREIMLEDLRRLKEFSGGKKMLMIGETHPNAESPAKEDRDFIAESLTEIVKAMAIVTPSAVGKMVANLFFLFKPAPYPMKMFSSVPEAQKWLNEVRQSKPLSVI